MKFIYLKVIYVRITCFQHINNMNFESIVHRRTMSCVKNNNSRSSSIARVTSE